MLAEIWKTTSVRKSLLPMTTSRAVSGELSTTPLVCGAGVGVGVPSAVAAASAVGMNGYQVGTLREGDKQIPIKARLVMGERAQLADLSNLYVYSSQNSNKVPLGLVSSLDYHMETEKIQRRQQFRTIEVSGFPAPGAMASQVLEAIRPQLANFKKTLPPGYKMEIGGEQEEQDKGFHDLTIVLLISITCIYLALVIQFRNAIKPFIVFATIPYGMVGALIALLWMGQPFGFMAFLGIIMMADYSLSATLAGQVKVMPGADFFGWLLATTFPYIMIALADFLVGQALYRAILADV